MRRGLARLGHPAVVVEREVVPESKGSAVGDGSGLLVVAESDTGLQLAAEKCILEGNSTFLHGLLLQRERVEDAPT